MPPTNRWAPRGRRDPINFGAGNIIEGIAPGRTARPCCCRSPNAVVAKRSISPGGRVVIELPQEIEGDGPFPTIT